MKQLNLPQYSFRISGKEGSEMIFDPLRKKWVRLTPEEWVRQNFVRYLIDAGKYPAGLIGIEIMFNFNSLKRRVDILVHNRKGEPIMIVECKSPDVNVADFYENRVFDQAGEYNMRFKLPYVIITNGINHYAFKYDPALNIYEFMMVIPLFEELSQ